MGFHGMSFGSLILILILAVLVFGTKRLRSLGEDLGAAVKSFRSGLNGEEKIEPPVVKKDALTEVSPDKQDV